MRVERLERRRHTAGRAAMRLAAGLRARRRSVRLVLLPSEGRSRSDPTPTGSTAGRERLGTVATRRPSTVAARSRASSRTYPPAGCSSELTGPRERADVPPSWPLADGDLRPGRRRQRTRSDTSEGLYACPRVYTRSRGPGVPPVTKGAVGPRGRRAYVGSRFTCSRMGA
jgi:hypothetical protein